MKVVYVPRAERHIANHLAYGIERFGARDAARTIRRLRSYIRLTVAQYPKTSRYHPSIDAYESWVPGTPFVIYYQTEPTIITVVAVFHHSRDHSSFVP